MGLREARLGGGGLESSGSGSGSGSGSPREVLWLCGGLTVGTQGTLEFPAALMGHPKVEAQHGLGLLGRHLPSPGRRSLGGRVNHRNHRTGAGASSAARKTATASLWRPKPCR